jgi:hypothetical protein
MIEKIKKHKCDGCISSVDIGDLGLGCKKTYGSCYNGSAYERNSDSTKNLIEKNCESCYQKDFEWDVENDEPCRNCVDFSLWEPEEDFTLTQSAKHDTGKSRVDLVSPDLILAVGHIRRYGVEKYGDPDNWKQVDKERYIAALLRHLCEVMKDFKSIDPESGLPHLWHVDCNANFLTEILAMEMEGVSE